jgi:hypothetical protein
MHVMTDACIQFMLCLPALLISGCFISRSVFQPGGCPCEVSLRVCAHLFVSLLSFGDACSLYICLAVMRVFVLRALLGVLMHVCLLVSLQQKVLECASATTRHKLCVCFFCASILLVLFLESHPFLLGLCVFLAQLTKIHNSLYLCQLGALFSAFKRYVKVVVESVHGRGAGLNHIKVLVPSDIDDYLWRRQVTVRVCLCIMRVSLLVCFQCVHLCALTMSTCLYARADSDKCMSGYHHHFVQDMGSGKHLVAKDERVRAVFMDFIQESWTRYPILLLKFILLFARSSGWLIEQNTSTRVAGCRSCADRSSRDAESREDRKEHKNASVKS